MECAQPLGEALLTLSLSQRIDKVPSTRSDDDDEKRIVHGACVRTREDGRSKVCEHWSWSSSQGRDERARRVRSAKSYLGTCRSNLSYSAFTRNLQACVLTGVGHGLYLEALLLAEREDETRGAVDGDERLHIGIPNIQSRTRLNDDMISIA